MTNLTTKKHAYTLHGYKFNSIGPLPIGKEFLIMLKHVKFLNTNKGSFKMGVNLYNIQYISTINFKKI